MAQKTALEHYFTAFRKNVIGHQQSFESPFGQKQIVYADWTASGRAYQPVEDCIQKNILPFVANTHTADTITGTLMSKAYESARDIVREHVNANSDDVLIFYGSGMTGAVNKLQRILGLRMPERITDYFIKGRIQKRATLENTVIRKCGVSSNYMPVDEMLRPVVFISHMEHNSNQVSWLETIATVEIIRSGKNGNIDTGCLTNLLKKYKHRKHKIAAITACSNVTGIQTPYHEVAKIIHQQGGLCFVDFACSAPYVNIDMHPKQDDTHLDAIYFSPHKFLGGPGTPGVLIFNKKMYANNIPDHPGGGTVLYTNPWKGREYTANIEQREDGGTPPFLGAIKVAMCVRLKEKMGVKNILEREGEILKIIFDRLSKIENLKILASNNKKRLGIISFIIKDAHHHLVVKLLNDRFGIQTRGGCSCAGGYGHALLRVGKVRSFKILDDIHSGNLLGKPGWIRLSVHPTMTDTEIIFIIQAIELTALHCVDWSKDYAYDPSTNEYSFRGMEIKEKQRIGNWLNDFL